MKENQNFNDPDEGKRPHLDELTENEEMEAIIKYGPITAYEVILAASGSFITGFFQERVCFSTSILH